MGFQDLSELAAGKTLRLPIDGHIYVVEDVDGETGLWAQGLLELGHKAFLGQEVDGSQLNDDQERGIYQRLLGSTFDELMDNGVAWSRVKHVFYTALFWVTIDDKTAEEHWVTYGKQDAEGEEEARPKRASRRAGEAAARTTKPRASTSGTRASKASAAPRARPGATSSRPGPSSK